jgi:hypothetical protein
MTEAVEEEGIGHTESIRTAGIAPSEQVVSQAMVVTSRTGRSPQVLLNKYSRRGVLSRDRQSERSA